MRKFILALSTFLLSIASYSAELIHNLNIELSLNDSPSYTYNLSTLTNNEAIFEKGIDETKLRVSVVPTFKNEKTLLYIKVIEIFNEEELLLGHAELITDSSEFVRLVLMTDRNHLEKISLKIKDSSTNNQN